MVAGIGEGAYGRGGHDEKAFAAGAGRMVFVTFEGFLAVPMSKLRDFLRGLLRDWPFYALRLGSSSE